jgi:hypothetical protein
MAFVRDEYCLVCKKETRHTNGGCDICLEKAERKRIHEWESKSTKAKLSDLRRRIEKLEQGPMRY